VTGRVRRCAAVLAACAVGAACSSARSAAPVPTAAPSTPTTMPTIVDPSERGPFAVGHQQRTFTDPKTKRALVTSVWYPVTKSAARTAKSARYDIFGVPLDSFGPMVGGVAVAPGRFPLIVFSHGNISTRVQSTFLTETLASHGFVVAAPDHVGDGFVDALHGLPPGATSTQRARDVSFVIDRLLADPPVGPVDLAPHIDADRIGVTGHSAGGSTSLDVAAGTYDVAADRRVKAIAPLAPGYSSSSLQQLAALRIPVLFMTGALDTQAPPSNVAGMYPEIGTRDRYWINLLRAAHGSFSIICQADKYLTDPAVPPVVKVLLASQNQTSCAKGVIAPDVAYRLVNRYVVAFFETYLAGVEAYAKYLAPTSGVQFYDEQHAPPTTTTTTFIVPNDAVSLPVDGANNRVP
jgi:predicted dienelactone hydrolase